MGCLCFSDLQESTISRELAGGRSYKVRTYQGYAFCENLKLTIESIYQIRTIIGN